jgi:hypothetical protein
MCPQQRFIEAAVTQANKCHQPNLPPSHPQDASPAAASLNSVTSASSSRLAITGLILTARKHLCGASNVTHCLRAHRHSWAVRAYLNYGCAWCPCMGLYSTCGGSMMTGVSADDALYSGQVNDCVQTPANQQPDLASMVVVYIAASHHRKQMRSDCASHSVLLYSTLRSSRGTCCHVTIEQPTSRIRCMCT